MFILSCPFPLIKDTRFPVLRVSSVRGDSQEHNPVYNKTHLEHCMHRNVYSTQQLDRDRESHMTTENLWDNELCIIDNVIW